MQPFRKHSGVVVPLLQVNIDTDQIIPKQFLKRTERTGYGAFAVSQSNLDQVKRYIANQKEHHRQMSFKEEFMGMLKKHGIPYDERYVWNDEIAG